MVFLFNTNNIYELDILLLPISLYNYIINKDELNLQVYLFKNPRLLFSIINFNNVIKKSYFFFLNNKINCNYKIEWITYKYNILSFKQQYMIFYYMKTKGNKSNMQYLFNIAYYIYIDYLNLIKLYQNNNISSSGILNKAYFHKSNLLISNILNNIIKK